MITGLSAQYIGTFRKLDATFERVSLVLGPNGVGKSSFVEAVVTVQQLILNRTPVGELLREDSRWRHSKEELSQHLSLAMASNNVGSSWTGNFSSPHEGRCTLTSEILRIGGPHEVRWESTTRTPTGRGHVNSNIMSLLNEESPHFDQVDAFFRAMERIQVLRFSNTSETSHPVSRPHLRSLNIDARDFAEWFSNTMDEGSNHQQAVELAEGLLRQQIWGYKQLVVQERLDGGRELFARFSSGGDNYHIAFRNLSHGQRSLIVFAMVTEMLGIDFDCLVLDEPLNHVAMHELNPFLERLLEKVEETGSQLIVTTHHPHVVDRLSSYAVFQLGHDDGEKSPWTRVGFARPEIASDLIRDGHGVGPEYL
jgi:predicted ATPase